MIHDTSIQDNTPSAVPTMYDHTICTLLLSTITNLTFQRTNLYLAPKIKMFYNSLGSTTEPLNYQQKMYAKFD